ncbi:hypothetical protein, partial [Enterobacter hormaechei]|uniref:hypothetical protein n=1 Tax=Enterobacter hormaechei TaxID=158836 RepID=UPI001CB889F5
ERKEGGGGGRERGGERRGEGEKGEKREGRKGRKGGGEGGTNFWFQDLFKERIREACLINFLTYRLNFEIFKSK